MVVAGCLRASVGSRAYCTFQMRKAPKNSFLIWDYKSCHQDSTNTRLLTAPMRVFGMYSPCRFHLHHPALKSINKSSACLSTMSSRSLPAARASFWKTCIKTRDEDMEQKKKKKLQNVHSMTWLWISGSSSLLPSCWPPFFELLTCTHLSETFHRSLEGTAWL